MQETEQANFFQKSLLFLKNIAQMPLYREPRIIMTQGEFFAYLHRNIMDTEENLRILGYDTEFMNNEGTHEQLYKAAKGEGNRSRPVIITAIIPESVQGSYLETLANESDFVKVVKYPGEIEKGYFVHDTWGMNFWNSTKLTPHLVEREQGVIERSNRAGMVADQFIEYFDQKKYELEIHLAKK